MILYSLPCAITMPCRPSKVDVNNDNLMRKSDGDAKRPSTENVAVLAAELIVILSTGPAKKDIVLTTDCRSY
jgi:hypothetical protein